MVASPSHRPGVEIPGPHHRARHDGSWPATGPHGPGHGHGRQRRRQGFSGSLVRPRADRTPCCRFPDGAHENPHHRTWFQSVRPEGRFHRDQERRSFRRGGAVRERMGLVAGRGFHGVPGPHEEVEANVHDPNPGRLARGLRRRRWRGRRCGRGRGGCAVRAAAAAGRGDQEGDDRPGHPVHLLRHLVGNGAVLSHATDVAGDAGRRCARIWAAHGSKTALVRTFKLSSDPQFPKCVTLASPAALVLSRQRSRRQRRHPT